MSLPEEALLTLSGQWPCRDLQIRQLAALLSANLPSPPTVLIYGSEATGKTAVLRSYLEVSSLQYAYIPCGECITSRHLLERILAASVNALRNNDADLSEPLYSRCESLSTLASALERLLRDSDKFVLVLDGIDKQREASPTLLPALARLGSLVPALTVVLIVKHPHPRMLHSPGVPHVHFPPYTREQAIQIVAREPMDIFPTPLSPSQRYSDELAAEDNAWLWNRYCAAVWDSLASGAARDVTSFKRIAKTLWRPFVQPIVDGNFGTRDFSRLLVAQRTLFQSEDSLLDEVTEHHNVDKSLAVDATHDLPYYSKWLLCAAYLASFNPARQDAIYFMKSSERKRRKRGGGTVAGRERKVRKIPRHLLAPGSFSLDRLFAILHAILPHDLVPNMDVYTQLATLCSLGLLLRTGVVGGDALEPSGKWKVNFSWTHATKMARNIGFDITDYAAE